jgi:hypothetical protein
MDGKGKTGLLSDVFLDDFKLDLIKMICGFGRLMRLIEERIQWRTLAPAVLKLFTVVGNWYFQI